MMTMMLPAHPFHRPTRNNGRRLIFDTMQDDIDRFSSLFPSSTMTLAPRPFSHLLADTIEEGMIDDMIAPAFALQRQAQCFANRFGCFDKRMRGSFDMETKTNANGDMEIIAPIPGVNESDVSIDVKQGVLTISVSKTEKKTIQCSSSELRLESQPTPAAIESEEQINTKDIQTNTDTTGASMLDQLRASASESSSIFEKDDQDTINKAEDSSAQKPTIEINTNTGTASTIATSPWGCQTSSCHAQRRVRLPKDHIEASITASMENGVLRIVVPRERPTPARKINIASRL